jgi:hypothetical protein
VPPNPAAKDRDAFRGFARPLRDAPISLYTRVSRTEGYTYGVWDLSIVQGPFSVAPWQTSSPKVSNLFIALDPNPRERGRDCSPGRECKTRPCTPEVP